MSKTAMQELIDDIAHFGINEGLKGRNIENIQYVLKLAIGHFLAKEKQQLIDAYNQGYRDGESTGASGMHYGLADVVEFADAEIYFNQTFKP